MTNEISIVKTAVDRRREIASSPEALAVLGPAEKAVYLASIRKPFSEFTSAEFAEDFGKALRGIARDIGYTAGTEKEFMYLVGRMAEIIKRHYYNLTLQDFRMAFEMCLTGELDDYLPKRRDGIADRGHYQNFNAEYICKVLNAYRLRRAGILGKAHEALPDKPQTEDAATIAKLTDRANEIFLEVLEYYRSNRKFPDGMTPITELICTDVLSRAGLIDKIEVTEEDQREILMRTIRQYSRIGNVGDMERLKEAGTQAAEIQPGAHTLARRKALRSAIEQIIKEDIKIEL